MVSEPVEGGEQAVVERVRYHLTLDADLNRRMRRYADRNVVSRRHVIETALSQFLFAHEDASDWLDDQVLADRSAE